MRSYRVIQSLRDVLFLVFVLSSFNLSAQSPGGVNTNFKLWLKANAGVTGTTPVSAWADQSGNGFNATAPGAAPNLLNNQLNFNPVLDFTSGSTQYLQITNGIMGGSAYTNAWVYVVSKADVIQNQTVFFEPLLGGEYFGALLPWSNANAYFDFGTTGGAGRINGAWGSSINSYNIWTLGSGASAAATPNGTNKAISKDGLVILSNATNDPTIAGNNQNLIIGAGYSNGLGTSNPFDGKIAELIIYTGVPSALEQEKIQSYLALKYGLTKNSIDNVATAGQDEADYFASNGAVIWDYSANTAYHNNVAGIGRDNTSQLNQAQSLSVTPGADVTISGTIASDLSFIVWGDNNAANGTSSDIPSGYAKRLNKVWKTNVTGTPGTASFSIDLTDLGLPVGLAPTDYAILIDGDGTFNSGATIHNTGAALSNGQLSFTSVPFIDGGFFTIAVSSAALKGPANVTDNLKLWLKANSGVTGTSSISAWADQAGNGFSATAPGNAPSLLSNQLNFNPAVDFNSAATQYLQINNGIMGSSSYTNQWVYAVSKGDIVQNNTLFYETLAGGEYLDVLLPWGGNLVYNDFGSTGVGRISGSWGGSVNNYNVWTFGSSASAVAAPNGTNKIISRDGSVILSNNTTDATIAGNNQNFLIGGGYSTGNGTSFPLDGKIAELIIFTGVPTPLEQEKVQSYLSLKYGLTKNSADNVATAGQDEADYFASNGTVIWDYSANTVFHNNVAGIGRDDASQLIQAQSLSANPGADVTITGSIGSDLSFIVWGDNNAANGTSADVPAGYAKRMNKVWKTNVSGTPGTVNFSIDLTDLGLPVGMNATDYALLIDGDGVFNSGATIYTTGAALSNGQLSFTNVPFADGNFFTIGVLSTALKGPANVTENLKLWLKANTGVTGTSPISAWADQSGNGFSATAPGNAPNLLSNQLNFNPVIDFTSASTQYLQINSGIIGSSTYNNSWTYAVMQGDLNQNNTLLFEAGSGKNFNVLLPWGNSVFLDFGSGANGRLTGGWGGSFGSYNVWTLGASTSTTTPSGSRKAISRDGTILLSNNNSDNVTGNNQPFIIGGGYNSGVGTVNPLDGKIAELIVFTGVPSELDQEKIQSYLSLKYGLTKNSSDIVATAGQDEADYFASNGTVVWDYSSNTAYHNNVAGIGRDNASQLNQAKSLSSNAGADVTMTGTIATDLSFIVWGDNNAANGTSTDVPPGYVKRMNKVWKTNVTGTPGTVSFSIDLTDLGLPVGLNPGDYALLIDGDGVFNSGATIYTTGAAINSGQLSFTNVPFADGNFFTIAVLSSALKGPANVTDNLKLWLRANSGVTGTSPISAWADQSGNGFNATAPGNAPILLSSQLNFNPVVDFTSASTQYLQINNGIMGSGSYNNAWIYTVSKADIVQNQTSFFETLAGGEFFGALLPWGNSNAYLDFGNAGGGGRINGGWGASLNNYYLWTLGSGASAVATPNGTNKIISRDGSVILSNNNNDASIAGNNQNFVIGAGYSNGLGTSNPFDGKIAEMIIYTGVPSPLEQEKIQSYLSLKYGLTKNSADNVATAGQDEADYFASNGAVTWDYSVNTAYHNRVAGIGRDDASQLSQQKSSSAYTGSIFTLDKTTVFGNDNSFVITGDDNGILGSTTSGVPGPYTARVTRIWKANVTGSPGTISLSFDLSTGIHNSGNVADYALMIKNSDTNFGTGATLQTAGASIVNNVITFPNVSLSNGDFFTLGLNVAAPGGIAGSVFWVKAGSGVTGTTNVSLWADQSGNGNNAIQNNVANQPSLLTNDVNFNPSINFSGSTTIMTPVTPPANLNSTVFTVAVPMGGNNWRTMFRGAAGDHPLIIQSGGGIGLGYYDNDVSTFKPSGLTWLPNETALVDMEMRSGDVNFRKNGTQTTSITTIDLTGLNLTYFGNYQGNDQQFGRIAETIIYNTASPLTTPQKESIESYLAVKYGVTLTHNYVASDGTITWNVTTNSSYPNRITGIGRNDVTSLDQRKSKSTAIAGSVLTLEHSTAFNEKDFLLVGDDGGLLGATTATVHPSYPMRVARIWKTQLTGTPGLVNISFDLGTGIYNSGSAGDYALLIKNTDTNFSTGATTFTGGANIVSNVLTFTNVPLANGDFFTLALPRVVSPGGVVNNIKLWLKAGAGVAGVTTASSWSDQTTNNFVSAQATAANQPTILTNRLNFNPAIQFDGTNDQLNIAGGIMGTSTYQDINVFAVTRANVVQNSFIFNENQSGGTLNVRIPWSDNNLYWDAGTSAAPQRINVNWGGTVNTGYLWSVLSSTTNTALGAGHRQDIIRNGLTLNFDNDMNPFTGNNSNLSLGSGGGSNFYNGEISELVAYAGPLTATQYQQIHSYLAIKYGVTLDQTTATNYVTSTGITVWDATGNSSYKNNITGVGRDDGSGLDQRKSKSLNSGSVLTIEKTTTFGSNLDFVIAGDDAGTLGATTTSAHPGYPLRITKIWRADLNGTPGVVNISFDLGTGIYNSGVATDYALLIKNSDTNFSTGATAFTGGANIASNVLTFTNVTLADGDYFSLALPKIATPGGVVNGLNVWLRADLGVYSDAGITPAVNGGPVSQWSDQTSLLNNGAATAIPIYNTTTNLINFNPTVYYDGTSGHNLTYSVSDQYTIFTMSKMEGTQNARVFSSRNSNSLMGYWNNHEDALYLNGTPSLLGGPVPSVIPRMYTLLRSSTGAYQFLRSGATLSSGGAGTSNNTTWQMSIGNGGQYSGEKSKVYVSEMIIYDRNLSSTEVNAVQSYLGVKYGMTLDQSTPTNYVASDGTIIWDATSGPVGNASYRNNIAGIGRDDDSKLNQLKSQSINPKSVVQIEKESGSFASNKTFLMWGADDNTLSPTSVGAYPGYPYRLIKAWRVDMTGTAGAVAVSFDLGLGIYNTGIASDYALVFKNANADFSSGASANTSASPSPPTINGNIITFHGVTFTDGDYFTLAMPNIPAPGGVVGNVQLWLKGNTGVTDAGGGAASVWTDQSGNGFNVTQSSNALRPTILPGQANFNTAVRFDGSNDQMTLANGIMGTATYTDFNAIMVHRVNAVTQSSVFYEAQASGGRINAHAPWNDNTIYWDAGDAATNRLAGAWGGVINTNYLWTLTSSTTGTASGAKQDIYRNGLRIFNDNTENAFTGNSSTFALGSFGGSNYLNGEISEIVLYTGSLSSNQLQRINSYLSLKYGMTLDQTSLQNYLASNSSVIYHSTTTHAGYRTDITGIGRDDNSALDQRKSKNVNPTPDIITIANGNFGTPTGFSNSQEFLIWGHNSFPYQADAATVAYTHNSAAIVRQLARVWSTDKTGSPSGNIVIELDMSGIGGPSGLGSNANSDVRLLIDNDASFGNSSAGEFASPPDAGFAATGGKIYFTVPYSQIASGQGFFTLGSVNLSTAPISIPYPGGVATNIKLWLKANAGVTGSSVSAWADQSGNGFTAVQPTAGSQPALTASAINFNPGLTFNGTSNQLQITSGILGLNTYTDVNAYVIGTAATSPKNQSAFWENTVGGRLNAHTPEGTNLVWDPGNTSYRLSTNWGGTINTPYMWSFAASTSATLSGARTDIYRNALRIANANTMASFSGNNSNTFIGSIGGNYYYGGVISEEIIYTGPITSIQQSRIHSYLALKYGLTLDQSTAQDYLAANATILYHATTTHNGYKSEIAGIGRDDDSALDQRQSKSINTNSIITMEKNTPAAAFTNNRDFVIWGDDAGSNGPTTIGAVNTTYPTRTTKTWKVDTNGTPGLVSVSFNLNAGIYNSTIASDYALLIKNADNDFTTGATIHTTGAVINSGVLTFTNVNFSDGDFFTLAMPRVPAPGGVITSLRVWLKANAGVYSDAGVTPAVNGGAVQQWTDQTQLGNNGTATGTPVFNTTSNTINFNPTVYYDGTSGHNLTYSVSGQYTIFTMSRLEGTQNRRVFSSRSSNYLIGYYNGRENTLFLNGTPSNLTGIAATTNPRLYSFTRANTGAYAMFTSGASLYSGGAGSSNDPIMQWSMGNGGQSNESSRAYVSESIIYDRNLSAGELSAVQSYLAIKYGITLDQTSATNYVTADGTVIWNGTTNVAYKNNIAGIGRDDRSALDQRKSRSVNTSEVVFMDKGGAFSNNKDFIVWGSDANTISPTAVGVHPTFPYRIAKAWRASVTGTPGQVNVSFDLSTGIYNSGIATDYGLMIKNADANFSTGAVTLYNNSSSPVPTLVGNVLTFYNVSFTNGDYFSLALPLIPAPGGVVGGMQLWVKANAGVSGSPVSSWADQSGNGFTVSQVTAANQPAFLSNDVNYNPSVQFDGTNDQLTLGTGILGTGTYNNLNVFMVARPNSIGNNGLFIEPVSTGRIEVLAPWTDSNVYWDAGNNTGAQRLAAIPWGGTLNTNYLWGFTASTAATPSGVKQDIYRNGLRIFNDNTMTAFNGTNSAFSLGSLNGANYYNGQLSENVIYTGALTLAQLQKIQSYFAVKYGITLSQAVAQSYYASDWTGSGGTVIWDAVAAGVYKNDVAAIGRDNSSALSQKQSASINTGNILTIGNVGISADNISNANSFSADKSFFSWAHNNLNIQTFGVSDFGTTVNSEVIKGRTARVWFSKETGTVGILKLRFNLSAVPGVGNVPGDNELADVRLLIDADGTFATGAISVAPSAYNNATDIIEFDYDFAAGTGFYFSLGTMNLATAPLPIELVEFEAIPTANGALVSWATESELNSDYFTVQVSQNSDIWNDVKTVKAQGTKTSRTEYEVLDGSPFMGRSYYRLKQVDLNGTINYSKVVSLDFVPGELQLYPNPSSGIFNLRTSDISGQLQSVRVISLQGIELARFAFDSSAVRMSEQSIDVSTLPAAPYIIMIQTSTRSYQVKLILTK